MYKFFQGADLSFWTVYSTPVFLGAFIIFSIVIFRKKNDAEYQKAALLPLEDDQKKEVIKNG